MKPPVTGACVYAGHDSREKSFLYENGSKRIWVVKGSKVPGHGDRQYYHQKVDKQIVLTIAGGLSGPIQSHPTPVYDPKTMQKAAGSLRYVDKTDSQGNYVMRGDSTHVFQACARALREKYSSVHLEPFANVHDDGVDDVKETVGMSFENFKKAVNACPANRDFFAYAGHGDKHVLPSAGLRMRDSAHFNWFLGRLREIVRPGGTIVFYACSTGVAGGFAHHVAQALPDRTVFGHTIAGHGSTNPEKARMIGGEHQTFRSLLENDFTKWQSYIKSCSDIWRRYPWMTIEEIRSEVRSGIAAGHHADDFEGKNAHQHHHGAHHKEY